MIFKIPVGLCMVRAPSLFLVASMSQSSSRYAHIDSLRAIAALLVVWMHTSEIFVKVAAPGISNSLFGIAHTLDFGRIGVVAFFAVSGFVIPSSLSGDRLSGSLTFAIKRFFRLYPLYWLSIPFGLLTTWYLWGKDVSLQTILWNLTMVQEAAGFVSIQGLYWTLQTELVFYGLCVLLFLSGWLRSPLVLALLVFVCNATFLMPQVLGFLGLPVPFALSPGMNFLLLHLGIMFWGALYRYWHDLENGSLLLAMLVVGFALGWLSLAGLVVAYDRMIQPNEGLFRLYVPYGLGIFGFLVLAQWLRLRGRLLVWLGTISYSIYLFHPVVMYPLLWLVKHDATGLLRGWPLWLYMAVTLAGVVVVSALTYRWVEQPAMRLGSSLARKRAAALTPA